MRVSSVAELVKQAKSVASGLIHTPERGEIDSPDGGPLIIAGVNVWKHNWISDPDRKTVHLVYGGQSVRLYVDYITADDRQIWIAAGEFVNNGFAFAVPNTQTRQG